MKISKSKLFITLIFLLLLVSGFYGFLAKNNLNFDYIKILNKVILNQPNEVYEIETEFNNVGRLEKYPKVSFFPNGNLLKIKIFFEFFQDGYSESDIYDRNLFIAHKRIAEVISYHKKINYEKLDKQLKTYYKIINGLIEKENENSDFRKKTENLNLIYHYVNKHETDLETFFYFSDELDPLVNNHLKILFYDIFQSLKTKIVNLIPIFTNEQRVVFFEEIKSKKDFGYYDLYLDNSFKEFNYYQNNELLSKQDVGISEKFTFNNFKIDKNNFLKISQKPFLEINWYNFKKEDNQFQYYLPKDLKDGENYLVSYRNFFPSANSIQLIEFSQIENENCQISSELSFLDNKTNYLYNYYKNCFKLIHNRSLASLLDYGQTQFKFKAEKNHFYLLRVVGKDLSFYNLPEVKISSDLNINLTLEKIKNIDKSLVSSRPKDLKFSQNRNHLSYKLNLLPNYLVVKLKNNLPFGFSLKITQVYDENFSQIIISNSFFNFSQKIFFLSIIILIISVINEVLLCQNKKNCYFYWCKLFSKICLFLKKIRIALFSFLSKSFILISTKIRIINLILFAFLNYWLFYNGSIASDRMSILYLISFVFTIVGFCFDDRVAFGMALFYLILTPFQLSFGDEIIAENLAILAYYGLVVGTLIALFTLNSKSNSNSILKIFSLILSDLKKFAKVYKKYTNIHPLIAKINLFFFEQIIYFLLIVFFSWTFFINFSSQYDFIVSYFGIKANLRFIQIFISFDFILSAISIMVLRKIKNFDYKSKFLVLLIIISLFSGRYFSFIKKQYEGKPLINEINYLRGDVWWEVTLNGKNFGEAHYQDCYLKLKNKDVRVLYWGDDKVIFSINSQINQSGFLQLSNTYGKTTKKYLKIK
jgi:hypothetical protein